MMKRERDTQRARVYKADVALKPFSLVDVSTVPLIEAYVRRVWASERVRRTFPTMTVDEPPIVIGRRGRSNRAAANVYAVAMPPCARYESVLIHELAHTITLRAYGCHVAGHGWQYCSVYLRLTLSMMGREAHDALETAFGWHGVRYQDPRMRKAMSSENPLRAAARFAALRRAARQTSRDQIQAVPAPSILW